MLSFQVLVGQHALISKVGYSNVSAVVWVSQNIQEAGLTLSGRWGTV